MKRVFFAVVVVFAMAAAHAQEKGLYIILGGEVGHTNLMYDLKDGSNHGGLGFGGYLGAQYFFSRHWGISFAGEFFQFNTHSKYNQTFPFAGQVDDQGDEYTLGIHLENSKEFQKTNFVEIPVMLVFQHKFGRIEKHGLYFGLGVKPQISISSSFNVEGARATAYYPQWELPFEPGFSVDIPWHGYGNNPNRQWEGDNSLKFGVAAVAEAGFVFELCPRVDLTVGASIDYGFLNINKDNNPLLYPTGVQQSGKYVAEMVSYDGLLNSDKIDRINPMSIRGKVGLRIKIGKLMRDPNRGLRDDANNRYPKNDTIIAGKPVIIGGGDTIFVDPPVIVYLPAQIPPYPYDTAGYRTPQSPQALPEEVEKELEESIYFDLDKSFLRPESKEVLDRKVALMRKYPQATLYVVGHTCDLGGVGHNDKLSLDRADAARDYLIGKGISPTRIVPVPLGMKNPLHINTDNNRPLNRRVDFILQR